MKRILKVLGGLLALALVVVGTFVGVEVHRFNASLDEVYEIPVPALTHSTDPAVIARGKHLAESVAACATRNCHGVDFGGGNTIHLGPLGELSGPNLTTGGIGAAYSDGELARVILHGVKKDGRSLRFMPAGDFRWLPDTDIVAILSYLRSLPAVDRPNGTTHIGVLGKVLDRRDLVPFDIARRIDHGTREEAPAPAPTKEYGKYLARLCQGCHGEGLSGGRIPGAPGSLPMPLNLTPDATGLAGWTYADFDRALTDGTRKNGAKIDPFMPTEAFGKLDDVEKHALFAYLQALPPAPLGGR